MDRGADDGDGDADDIKAQVLQTTLAEIEASRQKAEAAVAGGGESPSTPLDCCVICLDAISDPCTALPCGHTHFDFLCFVSWLEQRAACPLCKASVYKVRYEDAKRGETFYRVPNAPRPRESQAYTGPAHSRYGLDHTSDSGRRRSRRYPSARADIPRPPPSESEAIQRRRRIYRHQLYSLHVGSNPLSRYRPPPTPAQFSSTPHLVSRARLWLRRELSVFSFLSSDPSPSPSPGSSPTTTGYSNTNANPAPDSCRRLRLNNNAEFLLEYIIAILKTVDIQGSAGQAEAMLSDFLGRDHARLFLHELRNWLRSPCQTLAAWDREVQYPDVAVRSSRRLERGGGTSWRDREGDHWRPAGTWREEEGE
ncbi:hypothetical protein VTK56DRAFT_1393 [Thermocarpiscus australiensis]